MTLRERLHHQIDALDVQQCAALDALLTKVTRLQRVKRAAAATPLPAPYLRAQRLMAGQSGFAQEILDARVRVSFDASAPGNRFVPEACTDEMNATAAWMYCVT